MQPVFKLPPGLGSPPVGLRSLAAKPAKLRMGTPVNTRMRLRLGGLVLLPGGIRVRPSATPYKKARIKRANQVCELYYRYGLTHREIARMLCTTTDGKRRRPVSRQMVSLILRWATRRLYEQGRIVRPEDLLDRAVVKAVEAGFQPPRSLRGRGRT